MVPPYPYTLYLPLSHKIYKLVAKIDISPFGQLTSKYHHYSSLLQGLLITLYLPLFCTVIQLKFLYYSLPSLPMFISSVRYMIAETTSQEFLKSSICGISIATSRVAVT